jgi:hypothetical protein
MDFNSNPRIDGFHEMAGESGNGRFEDFHV